MDSYFDRFESVPGVGEHNALEEHRREQQGLWRHGASSPVPVHVAVAVPPRRASIESIASISSDLFIFDRSQEQDDVDAQHATNTGNIGRKIAGTTGGIGSDSGTGGNVTSTRQQGQRQRDPSSAVTDADAAAGAGTLRLPQYVDQSLGAVGHMSSIQVHGNPAV